jgi:hypothetical protein
MLVPGWLEKPGGAKHGRASRCAQKSFLRGCIYFNNRRSSSDCLIRDVSETGVRLIFSGTVAIPDVVDLYIPQKEQTLRAHVQCRHGDEIGVSFVPTAQVPEPAAPAEGGNLGERLQKLEGEVAALRRIVKRLQAAVPAADADVA